MVSQIQPLTQPEVIYPDSDGLLGIWQGERENRTGYWLRWWNENGELLLWGSELAAKVQQEKNAAQERAEQERQRAEQLAAQLRALGVEPEV